MDSSLKGEKTKVLDKSCLLLVALPFSSTIFLFVYSNVVLGSPCLPVDQLNADHHEVIFVYGNTSGAVSDMINDPDAFGFTVGDTAYCGVGRYQGLITCLPLSIPCTNRDQCVLGCVPSKPVPLPPIAYSL